MSGKIPFNTDTTDTTLTSTLTIANSRWGANSITVSHWFNTGVGIDVLMFHITLILGRFHLQQILESDVKQIPKMGHLPNPVQSE